LKCDEIKARILAHPVSEALHCAIEQFLAQRQGDLGVAVRSSSNQEDSNGKAFAGQFDTFLNVKSAAEVSDAVKKVWASLWTPHVITYQQSMAKQVDGTLAAFPKMAVVIQEMVDSYVSGVAFTVNPMGTPDEMMIESYFGQGEMVVAGEVSPDQFIVAKNEKLEIRRSKINLAKQAVASGKKKVYEYILDASLTKFRYS
jgi:phosphoenolpyruvate synthase/pyruvate phosphate dikinase